MTIWFVRQLCLCSKFRHQGFVSHSYMPGFQSNMMRDHMRALWMSETAGTPPWIQNAFCSCSFLKHGSLALNLSCVGIYCSPSAQVVCLTLRGSNSNYSMSRSAQTFTFIPVQCLWPQGLHRRWHRRRHRRWHHRWHRRWYPRSHIWYPHNRLV